MNYVLIIHLKSGVQEIFLPSVQNRAMSLSLNSEITKGHAEAALSLDIFDGVWTIKPNEDVLFDGPAALFDGLRIDALLAKADEKAVIFVEALDLDRTSFRKYHVRPGVPITVGSDARNTIRYNAKDLVSARHLAIEPSPANATLADLSRNGTFVNGKRVSRRQNLRYGDTVYVFGLKIIWLDDVLAVNMPRGGYTASNMEPYVAEAWAGPPGAAGPPSATFTAGPPPAGPPAAGGPSAAGALPAAGPPAAMASAPPPEPPPADEYYSRSPRRMPKVDEEPVEIDAPPGPAQRRKQPLWMTIGPSMTMVIPMTVGVLFTMQAMQRTGGTASPYMFMGIVTSATAAVIGVTWALVNARQRKKQEREDEAYRQKRYSEYLDRTESEIADKHAKNRAALREGYPHIGECMRWVLTQDHHMWERNIYHPDFLTARLGMGSIPAPTQVITPKSKFALVDDDLALRPFAIQKKFEMLSDVPICLSLLANRLVGVVGEDRGDVLETARIIAMELAVFHSYTDVKMVFIVPPGEDWGFAKWLPHVWSEDNSIRLVADGPNSIGEVLYYLSGVIRVRSDSDRQKETNLPHYVVFIADPDLVENEAAVKRITAASQPLGFSTLLFYDRLDRLPNHCTVIIQRGKAYSGYFSLDNAFPGIDGVEFDQAPPAQLDEVARAMSSIRVREAEGSGAIPQMLTFMDMYKTSDAQGIDVYRNWLENRTYESMKALIGARGGGAPLWLDIHEKYHGPHGLVAGTTGSGKSEMLQTYILSLAVSYHPYEVSFILIDYKGGGMAESFNGLAHVAGIITNLGGNQTNRALASIKSEIKRRQASFNEFKIKHIDSYIELYRAGKAAEPMPHLLIIADEFAELKKEQPDFVRELVSASRVGRSLGVHLILATQKPDGVVDDQIWSNTKFRVCLRVADKADSMGMLKHPEAAYITQPGRGYFQVGTDEIFEEFQSGWSGAQYEPDVPYTDEKSGEVTMINLWGRASVLSVKGKAHSKSEEKTIQLDAVTRHIGQIAEKHGIKAISNIWLPPLPRQVFLEDLKFADADKREIATAIGLLDDPVNQEQRAVSLSFTQSNHVIVCSSISGGKTTFLQTVLFGLATTRTPDQVHIYIADYGSRTLGVFAALPHVGGVVFDDDQDRTDKLIGMLVKELARRKLHLSSRGIGSFKDYSRAYDDVPAIVLAIDNLPAFIENNPRQEDNMLQLAREAASYGIYLFVACTNYSDVRGKLRQNIRFGVGLQLAEKYDYDEVVGVRGEITAEEGCPGRGLIKVESGDKKEPRSLEFQTALCLRHEDAAAMNAALAERFKSIADGWGGSLAARIPQVPKDLSYESLQGYPEAKQALRDGLLPLGYDLLEATLVALRPSDLFCYVISGAARSGKSNAVRLLALEAAACGHEIVVVDNAAGQLSAFAKENGFAYLSSADDIYGWLADTIVPEYRRRNQKIHGAGGRKFSAQAMADERQMLVFIHDFGGFLSTVYSDTRDMRSFLETVVKSGNGHKIAFFAAMTREDSTMHSTRPIYAGFVSWKEGVHLGGQVDNQRVFDFDLSPAERIKKRQPGQGHTILGGRTVALAMPEVQ